MLLRILTTMLSGSRHHGMVSWRFGWRAGLQTWTGGANIFNKQSQTANRGGPPTWWLGGGLTIPHCKTSNLLRGAH
jgi:hypothetical protein